ncbi:hypothetical protein Y032_0006g2845 [Ancylostoma ceylanicum]|uniref:Uncharacterized protein n=1 Tax=Ancylostoma ceylanicum TaxID=53326 RepID=A0A016VNP9_9BILA|nr:hypothetical protein Y032_0006g2845 [Ancylostoma ceylanicum]
MELLTWTRMRALPFCCPSRTIPSAQHGMSDQGSHHAAEKYGWNINLHSKCLSVKENEFWAFPEKSSALPPFFNMLDIMEVDSDMKIHY